MSARDYVEDAITMMQDDFRASQLAPLLKCEDREENLRKVMMDLSAKRKEHHLYANKNQSEYYLGLADGYAEVLSAIGQALEQAQ